MTFHIRALALHSSVELVEEWIVDHSEHGDLVVNKTDRNANVRESVNEVSSAIYVSSSDMNDRSA